MHNHYLNVQPILVNEFTDTQVKQSYSTDLKNEILNNFSMNCNDHDNRFLSLAYGCHDYIFIMRNFLINGISRFNFRKDSFYFLRKYSLWC